MPIQAPKRKKIEAKLGRSFESFLKEKLAEGLTPNRIGREVHLDPATIRYYIRKFKLSYKFKLPHQSGKKFQDPSPRATPPLKVTPQLKAIHLDICLCPRCLGVSCTEMKKAHELGRCVITCVNFREKEG